MSRRLLHPDSGFGSRCGYFPLVLLYSIVSIFLLAAPTGLWAGEIRMVVKNTTRVVNQQVISDFQLINEGNETAWNITIDAELLAKRQSSFAGGKLGPSETKTIRMIFDLPLGSQGTFPIYAALKYHDHAGRPFTNAVLAVAATAAFPSFPLNIILGHGSDFSREPLRVDVVAPPGTAARVALTCHVPGDIEVMPRERLLSLGNGRASTAFQLAKTETALPGSRYEVFITAAYDYQGMRRLAYTSLMVPVDALPKRTNIFKKIDSRWWAALALLAAGFAGAFWLVFRRRRGNPVMVGKWTEGAFDLLVIMVVEIFIIAKLSPHDLLTATIATGGDMASHYYTLDYLVHNLLPSGRISGWTPSNYAGFPILQLYFPLPFLIMALLHTVVPLTVAFKLGTLTGTLLLPVGMYALLRSLRCPFPGPAIGAILSLPFLFNNAQSVWGGNLLSTLAGEFAYSLSLSLALLLLGSLYRGCRENRRVVMNAVLVFLVGLSHGYTLIFVEAVSLFFLITTEGFFRRVSYLLKVYGLAFLLLAFWLVPLLACLRLTTPFHMAWVINSLGEIMPAILLPVFAVAVLGTVGLGVLVVSKRWKQQPPENEAFILPAAGFLWFACLVAGVLFVIAPRLGVIDIRYIPCAQLMLCAIAALILGWLGKGLRRRGLSVLYLLVIMGATMFWTNGRVGAVSDWAKWNYSGFEAKYAWPLYREINQGLRGTFQDTRVVYEHAASHNNFGTIRAFESLPLFSGRATLEGLYLQASPSAPFVFAIQSEVSREQSCPFRQFGCTTMDYGRARRHLEMFNVRELILCSPEAKAAIRRCPEYRRLRTHGDYEIWELTSHSNRYVVPLRHQPALYGGNDWKNDVYRWFLSDVADVHWVYPPNGPIGNGLSLNSASGEKDRRFLFVTDSESASPGLRKNINKIPIDTKECRIKETILDEEIIIETNWINKPLLIKMSYHPNWQVEGADKVYLVAPSFMLIFPQQERVRLYYSAGWPDRMGVLLTGAGIIVIAALPLIGRRKRTDDGAANKMSRISRIFRLSPPWSSRPATRRILLAAGLLAGAIAIIGVSYHVYANDPHRWFNEAVRLRDVRQFDEARIRFNRVLEKVAPVSGLALDSLYHIGVSYYLEGKLPEAVRSFEKLTASNPQGSWAPEARYHIGLCYLQQGQTHEGVAQLRLVTEKYPYSVWAGHARQRLEEHHALD